MTLGLGLGLGSGNYASGSGSTDFGESIVGNRNHFPYSNESSSNHVRNTRLARRADLGADYSDIKLTYANWQLSPGGDLISDLTDVTIRAGIEYDGVFYPVTFGGARDALLAVGASVTSDPVAGLTLPAGALYYERVRRVGPTGTNRYAYGHGSSSIRGEGQLTGTNTATDFTLGGEGRAAEAVAVLSGSTITDISLTNGGQDYSSGPGVAAHEVRPDGTVRVSTIGYATTSAGAVTNVVLTGGTTGWTNPTIIFRGGGGFGQSTTCYGAAVITGRPDRAVNSLLLVGDSIARGYGSTDAFGDQNRDFGIFERAIAGDYGVMNISSPGGTMVGYNNPTIYSRTYSVISALNTGTISHTLIALGTNDLAGGASLANITARVNAIRNYFRGLGHLVSASTIVPRTTSTDSWSTTANQTPLSGFELGGHRDQYNADIQDGTIDLDWSAVNADMSLRDNVTTDAWAVPISGADYTNDGIHPNSLGLPFSASSITVDLDN